MRSALSLTLILFAVIARGDAPLPTRAPAAPPGRETFTAVTKWPRVASCARFGEATVYASKGARLRWTGPGGTLDFPEIVDKRGHASLPMSNIARGQLTTLAVDHPKPSRFDVVVLNVRCADPLLVDYEWMCSSPDSCLLSISDSRTDRQPRTTFSNPVELASAAALVTLDEKTASGHAADLERVARRLLADIQTVTAAACTLGCSPEVDATMKLAAKAATAPMRFKGVKRSDNPIGLKYVSGFGGRFESADGELTVGCGIGRLDATAFGPRRNSYFCSIAQGDRPFAYMHWDPNQSSDAPSLAYDLELHYPDSGSVSMYSGSGTISVSGGAADVR